MTAVHENQAYAAVSRRLLPFLFACYICAYLDRVNLGFAKLQMLKDVGLGDAAFATGAGLFFIGYFFLEVPSNLLLQKFGARTWIARIMVSWGILSAAMMFVHSTGTFYLLRLLLGFAEAGFFPGIVFYLSMWYPARMRARKTAYFMAAIAFAGVVGNPVSGLILDRCSGLLHLAGWQWLFVLEGLPSVVMGIWTFFYLDSRIEDARWLTDEQKAILAQNIASDQQGKQHTGIRDAFTNGRVWLLCLVYFCLMVGLYGVAFWLPTITKAMGATDSSYLMTGLLSAVPYGIAAILMFVVGGHSDRTGERRLHTAGAFIVGGLGLVLCGLAGPTRPIASIIGLSLATSGILSAMPLFWTIPVGFLTSTAAAAGIGLVNSFGNLGGYVGPNIPVWMKPFTTGKEAPLYLIATVLMVGGLLLASLVRPHHPTQGQPAQQ